MTVGIKIVGCADIRITDCGFSGLEGGIDAEDCSGLQLNGNRFDRVRSPVKARRVNGLVAKGNVDHSATSQRVNGLQMKLIARLVKEYIANLKVN
ncbi:hypothetical protein RV040_004882 [Vibrio alginolyticus]|uniref:hypothetical protein n=1 Tax=Vibrio alginolyticus TaxID=663 RepID=UPI000375CF72|nr:hypothetical protein [Vibrio alginolyticus]EKA2634992.1 hypothetical protein [Vibrio alginolyticus]ELA9732683.1 hypothetical protein [Vibrio alginolyticus]ELB2904151.1 hypothetical protein [Vibrio alginolyticus]ELK8501300.1 hypothetical protein [Vibrio alginolyticus]